MSRLRYWFYQQIRRHPALGRFVLHCIPDWKLAIRLKPIGRFQIRLRRNRSLWLRDPVILEAFMFGALQRLIRPGDVVYDVGSNIGLYVRFMITLFGAGRVIGFEPMRENRELLSKNIELGGLSDKVQILPVALGEMDQEEEFQVDDMSSASGVLSRVSGGKASEGRRQYGLPPLVERVVSARLDSLIEEKKLPPPQVIKIDVEGAEGIVLRGAKETILKFRPRLAVELHGLAKAREVLEILTTYGYASFGYINDGGTMTYRRLQPQDIDRLTDIYDLCHLVASSNASEVSQPIEHYHG